MHTHTHTLFFDRLLWTLVLNSQFMNSLKSLSLPKWPTQSDTAATHQLGTHKGEAILQVYQIRELIHQGG